MSDVNHDRMRSLQKCECIIVGVCEGAGVDDDPVRIVEYFWCQPPIPGGGQGEWKMIYRRDPMYDPGMEITVPET